MLGRGDADLGSNTRVAGPVGQPQPELGVDFGLVGGVGGPEHGEQVDSAATTDEIQSRLIDGARLCGVGRLIAWCLARSASA
jgi:hypothetical protein